MSFVRTDDADDSEDEPGGEGVPAPPIPEPAEPADSVEPIETEPGEITRDLAPWASESRGLLAALLDGRKIDHVWQGTTLVTRSAEEATVARVVAEVRAAAAPIFDDEIERIVYEVGAWPVGAQSEVASMLAEQNINHAWDDRGDLIVAEADEAAVEAIFDLIDVPEDRGGSDDTAGGDDLPEAMTVMSGLFVAADRLRKNPLDPDGILDAVEWSGYAEKVPLPFGFSPPAWKALVAESVAFREAIEADQDSDDDDIRELAESLRTKLREYV